MGQHPPDFAREAQSKHQNLNSASSTFQPHSLRKTTSLPLIFAGYGMAVNPSSDFILIQCMPRAV